MKDKYLQVILNEIVKRIYGLERARKAVIIGIITAKA